MMHGYRHQGRTSEKKWVVVVFGAATVGIGIIVVYQLIGWFRASHEDRVTNIPEVIQENISPSAPVVLDGTATVMLLDGSSAGAVYRRGTSERAEYNAVFSLPALAPETSYELWMVKEGLVDVQTAGTLEVRADGSFAKVFSLVDPAEFSMVVIMAEPNDGIPTPSGVIVAQGSF